MRGDSPHGSSFPGARAARSPQLPPGGASVPCSQAEARSPSHLRPPGTRGCQDPRPAPCQEGCRPAAGGPGTVLQSRTLRTGVGEALRKGRPPARAFRARGAQELGEWAGLRADRGGVGRKSVRPTPHPDPPSPQSAEHPATALCSLFTPTTEHTQAS